MKLLPNWMAIIPINFMLFGGLLIGLWYINRPLLLGNELPTDFDYLAVIFADAILILSILYFSYIQYTQLNISLDRVVLKKRTLLGNSEFKWSELDSVSINLYALDIYFGSDKVQILLYLFQNKNEFLEFVKEQCNDHLH